MEADPIGYEGGMNLYAYVANDPMNFTDPLGLCRARTFGLVRQRIGDLANPQVVLFKWIELESCDSPSIPGIGGLSPDGGNDDIVVTAQRNVPRTPGDNPVMSDARERFTVRGVATAIGEGLVDRLRRFLCPSSGQVDMGEVYDAADPVSVMRDFGMSLGPGNIPGRRIRPNPVGGGLLRRGGISALVQLCPR
jgi:hypothetical protein